MPAAETFSDLWDGTVAAHPDRPFLIFRSRAGEGTRLTRSQALRTYHLFLEIRHKIEIHQLTRPSRGMPDR